MNSETYYSNIKIQKRLLAAVGRSAAMLVQQPDDKPFVRRYDNTKPIRLTHDNLKKYVGEHLKEVHPLYGNQVNQLVVDIDPGHGVSWDKVKSTAAMVAAKLQQAPNVGKVTAQFSGGRGFYIRGELPHSVAIAKARQLTTDVLRQIVAQNDDMVLKKPGPGEIRLDTTTFHRKGSLRAPWSLNSQTGLVSMPVSLYKIPQLKREDFRPEAVVKSAMRCNITQQLYYAYKLGTAKAHIAAAKNEYAPGIPSNKKIEKIPIVKVPTMWDMAVQEHKALKAGKHWDLRLVDPAGHAHSFAIPKSRFPSANKMLLAIQQPTHTKDYALNFVGTIPKGYGAGTVTMPIKEKVQINHSDDDGLSFKRPNGSLFSLFRTGLGGKNNWGLRQVAQKD